MDLGERRGSGFSGPLPLAWKDIWAYFQLIKVEPERWELSALQAVDRAFMVSRTSGKDHAVRSAKALGAVARGRKRNVE